MRRRRKATIGLLWLIAIALPGLSQSAPDSRVIAIQSALQANNYAQALQLATAESQHSPRDPRFWTLQGMALADLGNDLEALAAYDKALGAAPDFLPALEAAAQLEYKTGNPAAIPRLNRILALRPNDPTCHAMLATLSYMQHDCAAAVEHFAQSLPLISTRTDALKEYGACLMVVGQAKGAIPVIQQIVAQSPGDVNALYVLAVAQNETHREQDAIETLQPLLHASEPDPDVLSLASASYEAQGNTPKAVELLRQAIVSNPKETKYYLDFATLSFNHGAFQVGIDMLSAGLHQMPEAAPLYVARGVLYIQLAQYEKSEADFETAGRLDPKQASGAIAQGLALLQLGNSDRALAMVTSQLRSHPREAFLYYMKALMLAQKGAPSGSPELKEAIVAAHRAMELDTSLVLARDVLGELYLKSGQLDLAIQECRLALQSDPSDQNALYHLIQALRRSPTGSKAEITDLVKRLEDLRRESREQEALRSKYRIYESSPAQTREAGTPQ